MSQQGFKAFYCSSINFLEDMPRFYIWGVLLGIKHGMGDSCFNAVESVIFAHQTNTSGGI